MIEGAAIAGIDVNSTWEAQAGPGCELTVTLDQGHKLFVIRTGIPSTEEEVASWEDRVGTRIEQTKEITRWPLGTGGEQVTLDIHLEDGFTFEGDLILGGPEQAPEDEEADEEDIETEWVFEGTPGEEMGEL